MPTPYVSLKNQLVRHRHLALGIVIFLVVAPVVTIIVCHIIVNRNDKYIISLNNPKHVRVGLVLGAGITQEGKPFKELQARLDVAAKALQEGQVDKLLLSGDNRYKNYDEPTAMKDYLVNVKHISAAKLQPDFAGRSTYESCERANKVFGLHETIIYSAPSHLPRAIYLCRHFGLVAYGVSSGLDANNSTRRELLADVKAVYNLYIHGENTVLGQSIKM